MNVLCACVFGVKGQRKAIAVLQNFIYAVIETEKTTTQFLVHDNGFRTDKLRRMKQYEPKKKTDPKRNKKILLLLMQPKFKPEREKIAAM